MHTVNLQLLPESAVIWRRTAAQYNPLSREIDANHYATYSIIFSLFPVSLLSIMYTISRSSPIKQSTPSAEWDVKHVL